MSSVLSVSFLFLPVSGSQEEEKEKVSNSIRQEEIDDYYDKWLNQDVVYIIMGEERSVFETLSTPEERERFIEQFWLRRDPNPRTAANEVKEEHYRRIAYSNEFFFSGKPGWKTDRGRIYIIHGPPAEKETHPSGGSYIRPYTEGGGKTVAYPFEVWRYRTIDGIGDDIILEFVDKDNSGEYRMVHLPEDKDALLYQPGGGMTRAEELGLGTRAERPFFAPGGRDLYPEMGQRYREMPFYRYEVYSKSLAPQPIKYTDLQQWVQVQVDYATLPILMRLDYFRLNDRKVLVPISVQVEHKDLTFEKDRKHRVARVALYGLLTDMGKQIIYEFDDDLVALVREEDLAESLKMSSIFQRILPLDPAKRYKLELAVRDLNSGQTGFVTKAIIPPQHPASKLAVSSVILSNYIKVLETAPEQEEMFVLGDVKVRPNLTNRFNAKTPLTLYFQVYNAEIDQATDKPHLQVTYRLSQKGKQLVEIVDENGDSVHYSSDRRVVLSRQFGLSALASGDYQIEVRVIDKLNDQELEIVKAFSLM